MTLKIKDKESEKLATEIAAHARESKTGAVRQALRERHQRLGLRAASGRKREPGSLLRYLETEIWPLIPAEERGRPPMTKAEREEILGIGPEGH
jgi:antitoxin VapB